MEAGLSTKEVVMDSLVESRYFVLGLAVALFTFCVGLLIYWYIKHMWHIKLIEDTTATMDRFSQWNKLESKHNRGTIQSLTNSSDKLRELSSTKTIISGSQFENGELWHDYGNLIVIDGSKMAAALSQLEIETLQKTKD